MNAITAGNEYELSETEGEILEEWTNELLNSDLVNIILDQDRWECGK